MKNLDSILKSRDLTLPTKVCLVKAVVFPVVIFGCESWTIKKAENWRIDAFKLWCWRRLESPLDYKEIKPVHPKGNQSWIFIRRTDAEAEAPILRPLDVKSRLIRKDLDLGKIQGRRRRGDRKWDDWMASLTQWTGAWARSRRWWRIGKPGVLQSMGLQRVRHDWVTEQRQQRQIIRRKVYKFIYIFHGIRALIRNEDQRNGKLICSDSRLNREKHLWKSK